MPHAERLRILWLVPSPTHPCFEELGTHLGLGLVELDADSRVVVCGQRAAELLGAVPAALEGHGIVDVLARRTGRSRTTLRGALDENALLATWSLDQPDGSRRRVRAVLQMHEERRFLVLDDITERLRRADELNRLHQTIDRLESAASLELEHAALLHDLRNVLHALALEKEVGERTGASLPPALGALVDQAAHLSRLLRWENGGDGPAREELALGAFLQREAPLFEGLGGAVTIRYALVAEGDRVLWAKERLRSVVANLVVNARRAGARTLRISVGQSSGGERCVRGAYVPEGRWVTLEVRDDGAGMDEAQLAAAFTRGASGSGSTGLGLPWVLDATQEAGGFLAVRSAPGEGTVVRIHLPPVG